MNHSIVIITHNEDRDLEVTVALAWASDPPPHEIIVVDDDSELYEGRTVRERLSNFSGVQVLETPTQMGVAPSRNFGAQHCTGDTIIFLDSHMRMPIDWLQWFNEACDVYPDTVMTCANRGFKMRTQFLGCGARFTQPANDLFMNRRWMTRGDLEAVDWCPCVLGATYLVPMHVWRDLRGLNPNLTGWGGSEQDLSLRAWMFGYEVRRVNGLCVQHRYQRKVMDKTFMNTWQANYNTYVLAATFFEDGVFERVYEPFFRRCFNDRCFVEFEANQEGIQEFRTFVQEKRRFDDGELQGICDFRLPTTHTQRMTADAIIQKRKLRGRDKVVQAGQ